MDYPVLIHAWHDFFAYLAGCAATLTGLLFVAISLRPHEVAEHEFIAARALNGLVALLSVVLSSLAMLAPPPYGRPAMALIAAGAVAQIAFSLRRRELTTNTRVAQLRRRGYDVVLAAVVLPGLLAVSGRFAQVALPMMAVALIGLVILACSGAWLLIAPHEEEAEIIEEATPGDSRPRTPRTTGKGPAPGKKS